MTPYLQNKIIFQANDGPYGPSLGCLKLQAPNGLNGPLSCPHTDHPFQLLILIVYLSYSNFYKCKYETLSPNLFGVAGY